MRRTDRGQIITLSCIAGLSAISLATPAIVLATRQESNVVSLPTITDSEHGIVRTREINFEVGKVYKVTLSWSDLLSVGCFDRSGGGVIAASNENGSNFNGITPENCEIYVGSDKKEYGEDYTIYLQCFLGQSKKWDLTPESQITVKLKFDDIRVPVGMIWAGNKGG